MWGPFMCAEEENHHALVQSAHDLHTPISCVPSSSTLARKGVCREEGLQVALARHRHWAGPTHLSAEIASSWTLNFLMAGSLD